MELSHEPYRYDFWNVLLNVGLNLTGSVSKKRTHTTEQITYYGTTSKLEQVVKLRTAV